jgi:hypothetical protein
MKLNTFEKLSLMYLVTLDEDDMLQDVMESSSWFTMEHKYFNMTMCNWQGHPYTNGRIIVIANLITSTQLVLHLGTQWSASLNQVILSYS